MARSQQFSDFRVVAGHTHTHTDVMHILEHGNVPGTGTYPLDMLPLLLLLRLRGIEHCLLAFVSVGVFVHLYGKRTQNLFTYSIVPAMTSYTYKPTSEALACTQAHWPRSLNRVTLSRCLRVCMCVCVPKEHRVRSRIHPLCICAAPGICVSWSLPCVQLTANIF